MLHLSHLSVKVGTFELEEIDLQLARGEYFVLLGGSGTGKTVFLETIAGRYRQEKGTIKIDELEISALPPEKRNIGFVYQNYELFPHMTVAENIAFPLKFRGCTAREREQRAQALMERLSILPVKNSYPATLSGGEKQRAAIGRALAASPKLLLLDEPLSALDCVTKQQVKDMVRRIHQEFSPTVIHVTHDIEEALYFADRIGIMKEHTIKHVFASDEIAEMEQEDLYACLSHDGKAVL